MIGDPACICAGTGLVCRLGVDLKADPATIEICDCVKKKMEHRRERAEHWRANHDHQVELKRKGHERYEVLRTAAQGVVNGVISTSSGPAAPVFDEFDAEVERNRGRWHAVDGEAMDALKQALIPVEPE